MKLLKLLVLAATVGCVLAAGAAKVSSVRVVLADGDERTGDIRARVRVKVGDEYSPQECNRDVAALRDSGEFDSISADVTHGLDGIEITYRVARKMRFQGPLNVIGNDYWGVSKITKLSELQDGYSYGEADFAAAAQKIRREYNKKQFPDAKVTATYTPIPDSHGAVTVTMTIEEGPRVKVNDFIFEGVSFHDPSAFNPLNWFGPKEDTFSPDDLKASFDQYPWWNPMGWFSDVPVSDQDLSEARDKVAGVLRDRGYLDVQVAMPRREMLDNGKMNLVFAVVEGPRYTVGDLAVTGVTQYPEDAVLASNRALKTGEICGAAAMQEAAHQIEIFCGSGTKALADTHVVVKQIPSGEDPHVLNLTFEVAEGVPVVINNVVIRGNDYTKDNVIRREISLSPGDPLLEDKEELSKRRLENLRYFERVRYYTEKLEGSPKVGDAELRDLVYEVTEKNTGNFMVGIGASSVDSVYGMVELSESNFDLFNPWRFRGAGQKGRITVQAGPRIQTYEASVTEPYLFDRMLSLTTTIYRRQRWFDEYDVVRSGVSGDLSYPVRFWPTAKATGRLGFRLSAEYVEMTDVEDDLFYRNPTDSAPSRVFREEASEYDGQFEIPLRIYWEDDTRDRFLFPTRGYKTTIYGEIVGGENMFWKLGFNYKHYWTIWQKYGHIISLGLRAETIDDFSDDIPIYDRLFLGGPRSIRGVEYREVGPRVYALANKKGHHEPWGGKTSWLVTGEYQIPIVKMVKFAVFSDLGSVGEDCFDAGSDYIVWSVGCGLRLDIESFPIRLDVATPVYDSDVDVEDEVFSFSLGYDF